MSDRKHMATGQFSLFGDVLKDDIKVLHALLGKYVVMDELGIDDEDVLDHIIATFVTPFYYEHTKEFITKNKKQILRNVLLEVENCNSFKRFNIPIHDLRLKQFLILRGNEIEIRFEPKVKKQPIKRIYYDVCDEYD